MQNAKFRMQTGHAMNQEANAATTFTLLWQLRIVCILHPAF
jgi:hypothetical protein